MARTTFSGPVNSIAGFEVNGAPLVLPDVETIEVPEITTAGGTVIPAGTLLEALQAIADLADPETP